jgi:hypothetical protein
MIDEPFFPYYGQTQSIATVSGAENSAALPAESRQVLLANVGTALAFIRYKPDGVTADATAADMPLPAGSTRIISKDRRAGIISVFAAATGSTIYVCPGEGTGDN